MPVLELIQIPMQARFIVDARSNCWMSAHLLTANTGRSSAVEAVTRTEAARIRLAGYPVHTNKVI